MANNDNNQVRRGFTAIPENKRRIIKKNEKAQHARIEGRST
jgi:hypothetical protein